MSGFLIFVPDGKPSPSSQPFLRGLERPEDAVLTQVPASVPGPDGITGCLWYLRDSLNPTSQPSKIAYLKDAQTWRRGPNGDFWIGFTKGSPPRPSDLVRRTVFDGQVIDLNDGNAWLIANGTSLPTDFDLGDDGKLVERVKTPWKETYERTMAALEIAKRIVAENSSVTAENRDEVAQFCGEMLSLNYRLTPAIAVMLGLWDASTLTLALFLATDVRTLQQLMDSKKKIVAGDGQDTVSGAAA